MLSKKKLNPKHPQADIIDLLPGDIKHLSDIPSKQSS